MEAPLGRGSHSHFHPAVLSLQFRAKLLPHGSTQFLEDTRVKELTTFYHMNEMQSTHQWDKLCNSQHMEQGLLPSSKRALAHATNHHKQQKPWKILASLEETDLIWSSDIWVRKIQCIKLLTEGHEPLVLCRVLKATCDSQLNVLRTHEIRQVSFLSAALWIL